MSQFRRRALVGALAILSSGLAACGSDDPVSPVKVCDLSGTNTSLALNALQGSRVSFEEAGRCLRLENASEGNYLVVPQFASQRNSPEETRFFVGNTEVSASAALATSAPRLIGWGERRREGQAQAVFDRWLREQERLYAPEAPLLARELAAEREARRAGGAAFSVTASQVATTRTFKTLGNIDATKYETVTATLKYTGQNILIYVDNAAPAGFTDEALQKLGPLFDQTLYPIDTAAFGKPSDIDGNGKIMVLMTPRVNALVSSSDCSRFGFITGYFFGLDLASRDTTRSNRGEVFYTLVPDPSGQHSCAHSVADVERLVPATFIHELQHMISFGAHVLQRGGREERVWLNEGLSLIAEELGSLYYEEKYPPPTGRTNPDQLFPDSSQGFITNNLIYAYDYLANSTETSVTTFESSGTLEERGAAFLFLRWLVDQKGRGILRQLVQTNLTGIDNVAQQAGEPFPQLFGDFGVAVYTDSLPGVARNAIPARYRYTSRNLRKLFARLHSIGVVGPTPFPIVPRPLAPKGGESGSMVPGTSAYYRLQVPAGTTAIPLHLVTVEQRALDPGLVPQVNIFRLP